MGASFCSRLARLDQNFGECEQRCQGFRVHRDRMRVAFQRVIA